MNRAKIDDLFFAARKLELEGKKVEALQKYDEIHSIDRDYDKAWFHKFKILHQMGHTEKSTICAQNAVTLNPKWVKRIRLVEAQVRKDHNQQYSEIPLVIPKSEPKPGRPPRVAPKREPAAISKPKTDEERRQADSSAILFGILDNMATTIDDKSVLDTEGNSMVFVEIGKLTKHLDGKGPHRIIDTETKEEWVIERTGIDIVTHAHKGPKKLKDKSLLKESKEARLMLTLIKLSQTKRAWSKVSQEELQEILQRKAQESP